ncbi:DUF3054 domain-containing protein [Gordonia humi]|uniref:Lysylphosphatidylglycerol synthetase-like protein (DUF2156 family) n=1 Tax=Gordonia humi TaxID=686429 RepID=A0A840ET41_9ACTN|nr:DUF3054 domain-containing protein [Gordonia humi]MBB4133463.1 lysylphosphatidylglycerol synthetase-like protein (DUF2156 family) [Gordonia humi]
MISTDSAAVVRTPASAVVLTALADIVAIGVFVTIGRSSHDEASSLSGFFSTAWPFLVGGAVGWCVTAIVTGSRFRPAQLWPAGVIVWIATVVIGMVLRVVADQGTAVSFIVVATIATGVLLLGWRGVAVAVSRIRR